MSNSNASNVNGLQKVLWAVVTAVLLASGTYLLNSRLHTSELSSSLDTTNYRVEIIESRVETLSLSTQELQLSRATTDEANRNLVAAVEELSRVTDKLRTAVIVLEERGKFK